MPNLGRVDAVPVRALAGLEQVVDPGSGAARIATVMSPGFGVVTALRMWGEPEGGDDLSGGHGGSVGQGQWQWQRQCQCQCQCQFRDQDANCEKNTLRLGGSPSGVYP